LTIALDTPSKKQKEGLNVNVMNAGWGGKAPAMRPSKNLTQGSVAGIRYATMTQRFNFDGPIEEGPINLSKEEREKQKYDRPTGELKKKEKTTAMLLAELKISPANRSKFRKAELITMAKEAGIKTEYEEPVILEGWYGKPKGMLQVLWERGFIDDTQLNKYCKTVPNSWKNEDGSIKDNKKEDVTKFVFSEMLAKCKDFATEITHLEHIVMQISEKCLPALE
jgi:hypothetical protein